MIYKNSKQEGYTLLEIIVGLGVFTILTLSSSMIFQQVVRGQRVAISGHNTQESLRYTMEVMAKEIRNAQISSGACGVSAGKIFAVSGGSTLYFKNQYDDCITYAQDGNRLKITRGASSGYITPTNVAVSSLNFIVQNKDASNQASVTINMEVNSTKFGGQDLYKSQIDIQTTISSRHYE